MIDQKPDIKKPAVKIDRKSNPPLHKTAPITSTPNAGYVDPRLVFNNQVQIYNAQSFINTKGNKISKKREQFDPKKFKIIGVSYPSLIPQAQKTRRKYRIEIKYTNRGIDAPIKKQIRTKTINFGQKSVKDYVDDGDERKRITRVSIIQKAQDPFSPNHYRLLLLNRCPTIQQAYIKYVNDLGI